jgi:hypothetical protein
MKARNVLVFPAGTENRTRNPLNFRTHGSLPDFLRFTEHGLSELFKSFEIVKLNSLESFDSFLGAH